MVMAPAPKRQKKEATLEREYRRLKLDLVADSNLGTLGNVIDMLLETSGREVARRLMAAAFADARLNTPTTKAGQALKRELVSMSNSVLTKEIKEELTARIGAVAGIGKAKVQEVINALNFPLFGEKMGFPFDPFVSTETS
jgi:hypothetical protein